MGVLGVGGGGWGASAGVLAAGQQMVRRPPRVTTSPGVYPGTMHAHTHTRTRFHAATYSPGRLGHLICHLATSNPHQQHHHQSKALILCGNNSDYVSWSKGGVAVSRVSSWPIQPPAGPSAALLRPRGFVFLRGYISRTGSLVFMAEETFDTGGRAAVGADHLLTNHV